LFRRNSLGSDRSYSIQKASMRPSVVMEYRQHASLTPLRDLKVLSERNQLAVLLPARKCFGLFGSRQMDGLRVGSQIRDAQALVPNSSE